MSLDNYTDYELEKELDRRREISNTMPQVLADEERDWSLVETNAAEHLDNVE